VVVTGCGQSETVESSSPQTDQTISSDQTGSSSQTGSSGQTSSSSQKAPSQVSPSKPGWITSYEEGQQEAKANNKLVLLDFTGSDWCGWCILLDREVFSKPQFKEYASKNLVLVEVDFPKMKPLSEEIRRQNLSLAQRYQIQGFPTIVVLNGDGQVVGAFGYMKGGPDAVIAELEKMRKG
jgi:protein disulfide-isomerase